MQLGLTDLSQISPSLGNHDFHPANVQAFDDEESEHLVKIAEIWHDLFLGNEQAEKTFKKYGFYSIEVPVEGKNPLKVIQVNT